MRQFSFLPQVVLTFLGDFHSKRAQLLCQLRSACEQCDKGAHHLKTPSSVIKGVIISSSLQKLFFIKCKSVTVLQ